MVKTSRLDKLNQWREELRAAVETQDLQTFKEFREKWTALGVYDPEITKMLTDDILEISIRKMAVNMTDISPETQKEAAAWLKERGYGLEIK